MTSIEKAEHALNRRIEQLQANLRDAKSEGAQRFLFQSLVVCTGIGEALTDYIKTIGEFAQSRHGELKQAHAALSVQHDDLLRSGKELLERLKINPGDRALRKEIEQAQQNMSAIQKTLRRGANSLQRDVAPSLATIDKLAETIRRLGEADRPDALKRVIKLAVGDVAELYRAHPAPGSTEMIDAPAWEASAMAEVDQATEFYDAYARAGYQVMLALDHMTLAVSPTPPRTAAEVTDRANESAATRLKAITARYS